MTPRAGAPERGWKQKEGGLTSRSGAIRSAVPSGFNEAPLRGVRATPPALLAGAPVHTVRPGFKLCCKQVRLGVQIIAGHENEHASGGVRRRTGGPRREEPHHATRRSFRGARDGPGRGAPRRDLRGGDGGAPPRPGRAADRGGPARGFRCFPRGRAHGPAALVAQPDRHAHAQPRRHDLPAHGPGNARGLRTAALGRVRRHGAGGRARPAARLRLRARPGAPSARRLRAGRPAAADALVRRGPRAPARLRGAVADGHAQAGGPRPLGAALGRPRVAPATKERKTPA